MNRLTLTVTPAQDGRTVGSLMRRELSMADGLISSAKFRENGILVNGRRVRVTDRVHAGDTLSVDVSDRDGNHAAPLDIPVDTLWEDDCLAVLYKPAGICVYGEGFANLAGILACKWGKDIAFHPVNRLDVGTTGLMLAAKDGYTHDRLRRMLHTDAFRREYIAVTQGAPSPPSGVIGLPIGRDPGPDGRRAVDPAGLDSRTDYEVICARAGRALVRLRLHTGRTHQIRVHMAAIGCPLVGDTLYGAADRGLDRPALHSRRVTLTHPVTGGTIDASAPPPDDFRALLEPPGGWRLRKRLCERQTSETVSE